VYDSQLRPRGDGTVRTPWSPTETGAEIHPVRLAEAAISAIEMALRHAHEVTAVVAIGVTGMGETGVLIDGRDEALAPAIAWHDQRGRNQAEALERDLPGFALIAGRRANDRPSVVKWRWLADEGVDLRRVRRWMSVAEWVVASLGGTPASELSLASRTGAIDVRRRSVSDEVLAWCGAASDWFGDLVPAGVPAGTVRVGPPALRGATLTVSGLDAYASAEALDAMGPETALLSCGTSGAAIRLLHHDITDETMRRATDLDFTVDRALDGTGLVTLGATPCGLILQPIRDMAGLPPSLDQLTPARTSPSDELWRRAYEAVADGQTRLVRDLERLGRPIRRIVAAGGWIDNDGLRDSLQRRLGDRLDVRADARTAAFGAALVALRAANGVHAAETTRS
jgi:sugar (pentulose or hexulose) kinase